MQRRRSNNTEPRHLFYYDSLDCLACGARIWVSTPPAATWTFREIDRAYWAHVKKCFGLKKLIVTQRNDYLTNEKV